MCAYIYWFQKKEGRSHCSHCHSHHADRKEGESEAIIPTAAPVLRERGLEQDHMGLPGPRGPMFSPAAESDTSSPG